MRTAATLISDRHIRRPIASDRRRERDCNRTGRARRNARTAVVRLRKVAGIHPDNRNTRLAHRHAALVRHSNLVSDTRRVHGLRPKVDAARNQLDECPRPL